MKIHSYGNNDASIIIVQPVDDHDLSMMEKQIAHIQGKIDDDFLVYACQIDDWNSDLSPWKAEPVFRDQAFGEDAYKTLSFIQNNIIEKHPGKTFILGGYSLAGLFALWSAYQCEDFEAIVAASASLWFPGFLDYAINNDIHTSNVYLSLGDKEEKTRNPIMSTVGDNMRQLYDHYHKDTHMNSILEWNPGNHFVDADIRMAKGYIWAIEQIKKQV